MSMSSEFYFYLICAQLQILHVPAVAVNSRDNTLIAQNIILIAIDNSF
jgi:hypothetical protein